jgi:ABC-type branched-subunit amino acid transport system ATPase component
MNTELLARLQSTYRDLDLFPLLEPEDIERFRVEYGREVLVRLKREVEASEKDGKVVFAGHRGCGKSTLLKAFGEEMKPKYFVVRFSISDLIEMSDVSHVNILYSIAIMLLNAATKANIGVAEDLKKSLLGWTTTERKETIETEFKEESGVGADEIFKMITLKLQRERSFREELEKTYERKISDLVGNLDRLAATIQGQMKKPVLVIIDDLDKLDRSIIEPIYRDNLKALFSPAFKMVLTIPVSATQEPRVMGALNSEGIVRPQLFPVAKFFGKDDCRDGAAVPIETALARFEEILNKRFSADLLGPGMARKIALLSGGVMRELVRIGRECCTECMVRLEIEPDRTDIQIDDEILTAAIGNLRNDFARQIKANYDVLVQVYKTMDVIDGEVFVDMLHGLMVLEYENGDMWYDLHPIVRELLRRRKLIEVS